MCATEDRRARVPFLDLAVHDDVERREILDAVERVLRHGRLVLGPEVSTLEEQLAARCGRRYAVGVNSGTDALFLGLKALGIGPGDQVITTPLSFIATVNAVALTGATPVYADIGDDLNLDPASIEPLVTPRTRAILPVHYTGRVCRMDEVRAIAARHRLLVVEDASQAFGATLGGRPTGSLGDLGCISLNPMKTLAACGEAGVVVTDDLAVRDRLIALRYNGLVDRENCHWVSLNGRLDTVQAAILLARLPRWPSIVERRRRIAETYSGALRDVVEVPGVQDVWYTYTVRTPRRDELIAHLEASGIEARVHHRLLMPQHEAYRSDARGCFPRAGDIVRRIVCLPCHEKLSDDQVTLVVRAVRGFLASSA